MITPNCVKRVKRKTTRMFVGAIIEIIFVGAESLMMSELLGIRTVTSLIVFIAFTFIRMRKNDLNTSNGPRKLSRIVKAGRL